MIKNKITTIFIISLVIIIFSFLKIASAEIIPGYCKYYKPISVGGGDNYGESENQDNCLKRNTWTAFCPNSGGGLRDATNCSCTKQETAGWGIIFFPDFERLNSPAFSQQSVEANCQLSTNKDPQEAVRTLKTKLYALTSWLLSVDGLRYSTIPHVDGCVKHCRQLGADCLSFFTDKEPNQQYKNYNVYTYTYNHPLFGSITADANLIMEFMKRNNSTIVSQGVMPNKCGLRDILEWPAGCVATDSLRDPSTTDCADKPTEQWKKDNPNKTWKPSEHCKGQAIDISCGETWSDTPNSCGPKTTKALEIIQSYWSGKKIIRECTVDDRRINGTTGQTDIIHLDWRNN